MVGNPKQVPMPRAYMVGTENEAGIGTGKRNPVQMVAPRQTGFLPDVHWNIPGRCLPHPGFQYRKKRTSKPYLTPPAFRQDFRLRKNQSCDGPVLSVTEQSTDRKFGKTPSWTRKRAYQPSY